MQIKISMQAFIEIKKTRENPWIKLSMMQNQLKRNNKKHWNDRSDVIFASCASINFLGSTGLAQIDHNNF